MTVQQEPKYIIKYHKGDMALTLVTTTPQKTEQELRDRGAKIISVERIDE